MEIGGLPVTFLDTAGLRDNGRSVWNGPELTARLARAEAADLRVFLSAGKTVPGLAPRGDDLVVAGKVGHNICAWMAWLCRA